MADQPDRKKPEPGPGRLWRIGLGLALAALALALLYWLRRALTPVFVALLFAYLLDPMIHRIERLRLNRSVAIFILAGVTLVIVAAAGTFFLVQGQKELVTLSENLPQYLTRIRTEAEPFAHKYLHLALPKSFDEILEALISQLSQVPSGTIMPASKAFGRVLSVVTSGTVALASWVVGLLVIPILLYYFLRDWDSLLQWSRETIPLRYRAYAVEKARQVDAVLGAFVRGQLTVCVVLGIIYSLGLSLLGVNLAVIIGLASGAAFIVPYLGTILGIAAASLMALLEFGVGWELFGVWGVFGAAQALEGVVLTPRITGKKVGLSPVMVILALLIAGRLLGFLGILIAVPTAAVLKVFVQDALEHYRKSDFFSKK